MDRSYEARNAGLSVSAQKDELFKKAEQRWRMLYAERGMSGRKVDCDIYKNILYSLEVKKVYLDSKLSLEKFSSIVGTNTTYLSNAVNNYFGCNFKQLINSYRVELAKRMLDGNACPVNELFSRCGFASKSVFYAAFGKMTGFSPLQYLNRHRHPYAEAVN